MIAWTTDISSPQQFHSDGPEQCTSAGLLGDAWPEYSYIQLLRTAQADAPDLSDLVDPETQAADTAIDDRLSTIPEDSEGEASIAEGFLGHVPEITSQASVHRPDPEDVLWASIELPDGADACVERTPATSSGYAYRPAPKDEKAAAEEGFHYFSAGADDEGFNRATEVDDEGNAYVEMLFPADSAKLIVDGPPEEGSRARVRVYVAHGKKAVVDRDTDLLTAEEYDANRKEVAASVLQELRVWIEHK